jgi:hypothetical protein
MVHRKSMYPDTLLHMLDVWGTVVHRTLLLVHEQGYISYGKKQSRCKISI